MPDDTLSADAMLALANDYDAGVDIDSQPKEQSPNTNETAPVEQESSDAGNAGKEVDGGEQEVGTKSEPEAKAEKKADKEKKKVEKAGAPEKEKAPEARNSIRIITKYLSPNFMQTRSTTTHPGEEKEIDKDIIEKIPGTILPV